ncbi:MAG: HEAT repeat domain-containing protein [Planctomycetota bacterium]|nr:HEAT repeat domain-containing protein [Planctomycetota bacterium]
MRSAHTLILIGALALASCREEPSVPPAPPIGLDLGLNDVLGARLADYADADPRRAPWPEGLEDSDLSMVQGLLATLAGSNPRYADLARQDLESLGLSGLRPLLQCLDDARKDGKNTAPTRWFIARALGPIPHSQAALALLDLAKLDPDSSVRSMAIYQLGESPLAPDWVVPHLCLRLKYEKDPECHRLLGEVLAKHRNYSFLRAWFDLTRSPDSAISTPIWTSLRNLEAQTGREGSDLAKAWAQGEGLDQPEPSRAFLFEVWTVVSKLSSAHFQLRGVDDARFALSDLGPWLATEIAPALKDSDLYVRLHMGQVLQRHGPRGKAAVPALIEALGDPDLAPQAATTLAAIGERAALQPLLTAAGAGNALDLRTSAVQALGTTAWPESADVLRTALVDASIPGQADLGVHARCSLLQVSPTPEIFDTLLQQLEELAPGKDAAELAFESMLQRRTRAIEPAATADKDWEHWNQMGQRFGARPSVPGLAKRRENRAAWIRENRDRLIEAAAELAASR